MKARRGPSGEVLLLLPQEEADVLRLLPDRLRAIFRNRDVTNRIVGRLFPATYRTKAEQQEYQGLLGDDLRERKLAAVQVFEESLGSWKPKRGGVEVTVAPADFDRWLAVVNDMRLVIGTELDIREEGWGANFDPDHPQAEQMGLLLYLTWLEEELLRVAGTVP